MEYMYIYHSWLDTVEPVFPSLDYLLTELLLTSKLPLKQSYMIVRLKCALRTFYGCYHDLVDRWRVSILQMTKCLFPQPFYSIMIIYVLYIYYGQHDGCHRWSRNYSLMEHLISSFHSIWLEKFEDTKGVIWSRNSKDRQYNNDTKNNRTNNHLQNIILKTKDRLG